jgi:hypothetical protein
MGFIVCCCFQLTISLANGTAEEPLLECMRRLVYTTDAMRCPLVDHHLHKRYNRYIYIYHRIHVHGPDLLRSAIDSSTLSLDHNREQ